jgi:hypothetical protein
MAKASDGTAASIIERAKQIRALAESERSLGHEEAAKNFAAILQNLLLKHELDMVDVDAHVENPIETRILDWSEHGLPRSKTRCTWTERLAYLVTRSYGCGFMVTTGTNRLVIVGKRLNRELCEYTLVVLCRSAREVAESEYSVAFRAAYAAGEVHRVRGFKKAFLFGFVTRVGERLAAEVTRFKDAESRGEMALVRVDTDADEAMKFAWSIGRAARTPHVEITCAEGLERGRARAEEVDLGTRGVTGTVRPKLSNGL